MKKLPLVLFLTIVVALTSVTAEDNSQHQRILKVGAILGLTGDASVHGNNILQGIKLAKADLEQLGWKVDLAVEDDNTKAAKTISALQALNSRGYKLIIGPTWSFQVEAAIPVLERLNIIAFSPAISSVLVGRNSKNVFYGTSFGRSKLDPLIEWLRRTSAKNIAIIFAESPWGEAHKELYIKAIKKAGAKSVAIESFS